MFFQTSTVEAYGILGLEQGSSLEEVKSAYRQLALRTHPDKNPDNPAATAEFQLISAAYNTLVKHLDRPAGQHGSWQSLFGYDDGGFGDHDDYDDEFEYEPDIGFYFFLYEEVMRERESGFARAQYFRPRQTYSFSVETPEQYQERMRRVNEEQAAAAERRAKEAGLRKMRQEAERERERQAAEERQKLKAQNKKAQAEKTRHKAETAARARAEHSQMLRSETFDAARRGNADRVKKGVWEDEVDASGGEMRLGGEEFVQCKPKDPHETLLHISADRGDIELVKWLDAHSADLEERNAQGLTAFHIALRRGHVHIVKHFLDSYSPKESEYGAIYSLPASGSLLSLAIESGEPEIVWMILDRRLASARELNTAWTHVSSDAIFKTNENIDVEKLEEIHSILKVFGDFTPPLTPEVATAMKAGSSSSSLPSFQRPTISIDTHGNSPPTGSRTHGKKSSQHKVRQQTQEPSSPPASPQSTKNRHGPNERGRGGGRGRGRGRSRAAA